MLIDRIVRRTRYELGIPPRLTHVNLSGHAVTVREGTIQPKPDKDDGWMAALISDSAIFLDVGCNVGFWSLYAAMTSSTRTIISWDTNINALARCAENLFLNGVSHRVRFVLGFASAQADQLLEFYTVGTDSAGSRYAGHARTASSKGGVSSVTTRTIDTAMRELQLIPDLIKMDVEGAEAEALEGAKELARKGRPRFFVEMHAPPELSMIENCRRVLAWCEAVAYKAYYLKDHKQITSPDPVAHRGRCHLLLLPVEAACPVWLDRIEEGDTIDKGVIAFGTART